MGEMRGSNNSSRARKTSGRPQAGGGNPNPKRRAQDTKNIGRHPLIGIREKKIQLEAGKYLTKLPSLEDKKGNEGSPLRRILTPHDENKPWCGGGKDGGENKPWLKSKSQTPKKKKTNKEI